MLERKTIPFSVKVNADMNVNPLKSDDFTRFIIHSPDPGGLFWRMKILDRKIEFLNDADPGNLGTDAERLLQDLVWAQKVVAEEDFFRFKLFIKTLREGIEASVVFRIREIKNPSNRLWLKIVGKPAEDSPSYYYGCIRDITKDVDFINHLLEKDLERQTMIESENLPVLLVDMETKAVISRSTFAYDLFEYNFHEFNEIKFQDLYPADQGSHVSRVYETCLLEGHWEGNLSLVKRGNISFDARVKLKRLSLRDRNLLKISIVPLRRVSAGDEGTPAAPPDEVERIRQSLLVDMENKYEIEDVLGTLLARRYTEPIFEAVMYVDIYVKKRKVDVYVSGDPFFNFKSGASYDYEGTISQAIRENQLDFLIMEDTLESTKPIDWALFVPYGVRSYIARPFYHGSNLRTLLMFCSTEPHRFTETDLNLYDIYYPAFLQGLRNWRKRKKEKILKN